MSRKNMMMKQISAGAFVSEDLVIEVYIKT